MSFLDEAKRRIALAVKANESAPEPDDAELKFRKGMAMVLENLDKADEKQPAANAQRGPKTPDLESYFSTPTRKTDTRTPDIGSYFD
ncbi:Uncharacterised protein [Escherichia coli]|uniref:hypothetical protein n=1 Tax=Escherichia coli TaxID=562 RepID=UPI0006A0424B|nr:hypothetical protein [Escherichia coli]CTS52973.1 Uncharacterised protein [Escherichia coli]CTS63120.1 Uncharacterised protein [Escherichia coli]CTY57778.1 Uncharacterised protein [Escherichia coli]